MTSFLCALLQSANNDRTTDTERRMPKVKESEHRPLKLMTDNEAIKHKLKQCWTV